MDCPECGHSNPGGSRFCNECGEKLGETSPATAAVTPEHLAEKIRAGKAALEGERKQVTVMFADVMGSMELAEQTDPEALRRIMDRFFAILSDGVHRFEGTVDKFTGDGIMALFGAPIAHEDHAHRACYAALHLRDQLAEYANELRRTDGLNFSVRIGINSGEVVVGAIGEDLALDYTAIGQTVGLAQRMEALAQPGSAYLTESTAELVEGFFELDDLGEFDVKGVTKRVGVRELRGIGTAKTRLEVSRRRGFSLFVGRDDELEKLKSALERSRKGEAQIIGIVGEPGVGKSRLSYEFLEHCRTNSIPVYQAAGLAHARSVPLVPVLQMMRSYFEIADEESDQAVREKVAGRLLLLDPGFQEELPLFFEFLGVPDPDNPAPGSDPESRKRRLLELVRRLVHAQSERDPGVSLFEDLHWIDPSSEEFLAGLAAAIVGSKTLVVVNFRPEYEGEWMSADHYTQIELEPLGAEAVGEMLEDLLGPDPSLDGLAELIQERTQGNPFFVEEVVQELIEAGQLSGSRGAYKLGGTIEDISVPNTVQSVLAARTDRLPGEQKAVLQAASVLGREFSSPVLARVAGVEQSELEPILSALVEGEFFFVQQLYPEPVHSFKHPLTQEVAYGSLLAERRRALHAEAARAIAEIHPERADEQAALIAGHWEHAEETREAARWHARAATWAGYKDPGPTLGHWRRVRELVTELDEDEETATLDMTSRLWTMQFGWRLGIADEEATEHYERGVETAKRQGNTTMLAMFESIYATASNMKGEIQRADKHAREAIRIADESGDPTLRIAMRVGAAYVFFLGGRLEEALETTEIGIEIGRDDPSLGRGLGVTSPYAFHVMFRGGMLSNLGRLDEARDQLERSRQIAREEGDPETEAWSYTNRVHLAWSAGEPEEAVAHATRGLEIGEAIADVFTRIWMRTWLGIAHHSAGDWETAAEVLEEALEMSRSKGTALDTEPWRMGFLADCYAQSGDPRRALEIVDEARRLLDERGSIASIGAVEWARARALIADRGADAAEEIRAAIERCLENCREIKYRSFIGQALLEHARLADLEGDEAERERWLREAREAFEEVGASGWVSRTDELLATPA